MKEFRTPETWRCLIGIGSGPIVRRHPSVSDQSLAIPGLVEISGLVEADWRGQFR
jgi:hypothetical protein